MFMGGKVKMGDERDAGEELPWQSDCGQVLSRSLYLSLPPSLSPSTYLPTYLRTYFSISLSLALSLSYPGPIPTSIFNIYLKRLIHFLLCPFLPLSHVYLS